MTSNVDSTDKKMFVESNRINSEENLDIKNQVQDKMAAYLMVYFKDNDHSLHMALSKDGKSFTDIKEPSVQTTITYDAEDI